MVLQSNLSPNWKLGQWQKQEWKKKNWVCFLWDGNRQENNCDKFWEMHVRIYAYVDACMPADSKINALVHLHNYQHVERNMSSPIPFFLTCNYRYACQQSLRHTCMYTRLTAIHAYIHTHKHAHADWQRYTEAYKHTLRQSLCCWKRLLFYTCDRHWYLRTDEMMHLKGSPNFF